MKRLTNKGSRRLGIPGRPALILNPDEHAIVDENQLRAMQSNRTVSRWLESGVLLLTEANESDEPEKRVHLPQTRRPAPKRRPRRDDRKVQVMPEGLTGEGTEYHHLGGGWYQLFVNGFKVTDRNVRKAEAENMASEYEE